MQARKRPALTFPAFEEMAVMDGSAIGAKRYSAVALSRLYDLHASFFDGHRHFLRARSGPALRRHRLGVAVQHHGMIAVAAFQRLQPVRVPDVGGHPKPDKFGGFRELFGYAIHNWRRREFLRLANVGPNVTPQLLGGI